MKGSYVLEIPDLDYVLNHEDVKRWEVFLLDAAKQYEKIKWQASFIDKSGILQQELVFYGRLKTIKIDFQNKRIVFFRGEVRCEEFEKFLLEVLNNSFIRIRSDQMHFVVSPGKLNGKEGSTMR
ncbi:hypothetical protein [Planomicrobium sp. CPCC 101079]|uniref:hypothetical protein n=1 Tax=Planomicrobium sp. CPCC 101079 TaxID=2599618 RepID=UPI0011B7343A|nr:hypothetical protein [Planomicrobium sp. CPCC 101079]TWT03546.1 hypothetical protein FQV28_11025 [Planomicrobium sp. CPCC 101079]